MKKKGMNAVTAERLFGVVIVLLLVGLVSDFIFVTNFLKSESIKTEILHKQSDATESDISKLKSADAWLKENEDVIKRTSAVVGQSKLYQYQNQIIEDFNGYGSKTGVPILGYTFAASSTTVTTPTASATPAAPTGAAAGAPVAAAKAPVGVNSITITVTFGDKVNYQKFLNFLRLLEQNVTRMQVSNISLTPDSKDLSSIVNPNVTVIVYTR